jgi:hypothetical protein
MLILSFYVVEIYASYKFGENRVIRGTLDNSGIGDSFVRMRSYKLSKYNIVLSGYRIAPAAYLVNSENKLR